jgi:branched-chain amino acid aminotransferase
MHIYIDGEWHTRETARVSVFDHGFLYGDGVFEGIRVYNRRVFRLDVHLARLAASARALALPLPTSTTELADLVRDAVRRNRLDDAYIRLIVTRGVGDLGIDPRTCAQPTLVIIVTTIQVYPPDLYATGIRLITSATRQVSHEAVDPRVKSLNYLKNILAKIDAYQAGAHEAILLNADGFIAECTADNLFVVQAVELRTPAPLDGALEGITRAAVLELARDLGLPAGTAHLTRYDVYTADECFVTGTGAEVMPVVAVDGRPVGNGGPGPVTRQLSAAFRELARSEGSPLW